MTLKPPLKLIRVSLAATALGLLFVGYGCSTVAVDRPASALVQPAGAARATGEPVRDGKFEFTIKNVDCGKKSVGQEPLQEKAQGEFCVIALTVKNIGSESQTFDASSQKAKTDDGTTYEASTTATLTVNENNTGFFTQINPGNQVKGIIVYDVPPGTKLTKIELHDSPFSNGVETSLK